MKKKLAIIIPIAVLLLLTLCLCILMYGKDISVGRCIVIDADTVLWIDDDGSPIEMHNRTSNKDIFANISTGDEIWILHDNAIAESYPAQVGVYFVARKSDGDWNDIPENTVRSLQELGWLDENYAEE